MLTKLSAVAIAVTTGLLSYSVQAETSTSLQVTPDQAAATHKNIERIEVTGRQFNHYKVGTASGAMRGNIDLMDTPQSVAIIPDFVTDEQLAKNLGTACGSQVNRLAKDGGQAKTLALNCG